MYPKNAGTPPRISIGPVLLIADGTVQTADVLVKVTPEGGAAGASGGTISYVEGIVHYAPTQAETNYTAFTITAYKASCIPTSVTVVTTASSTAGYALVPDTQKVDVNTIKTKAITCGAAITVGAYVGSTAAASIHTAANVYTAFGDGANLSTCATATGFATLAEIEDSRPLVWDIETDAALTDLRLSGITKATSTEFKVYINHYLTDQHYIALYSDVGKTDLLAAVIGSNGTLTLVEQGGSGVTGTIEVDGASYDNIDSVATLRPANRQADAKAADSAVDAILIDTDNLQTNQGNWVTATGFATPTNITSASGIELNSTQAATTFASITCTGAFTISDGIIVTASTENRAGMAVTGNGSGAGMEVTGGTSGDGAEFSGGTNGHGIECIGTGSSHDGIRATGYYGMCLTTTDTYAYYANGPSYQNGGHTMLGDLSISGLAVAVNGVQITHNDGAGLTVSGTTYGVDIAASAGDGIRSVGSQYDINADIQGVVSGNSTHTAANVYTAFGDGANLSTCATAAGFATETKQDISDSNVVLVLEDTGTTLPAAIAALDTGAGTGARTVTLTVNDGSDALESASVRVTKGAATYVQTTDTSGKVTFNLDNGTYTVAVSLIGYTYSGTTIVVDGDETATYSMTAISITGPSAASLCTVQFRVNLSATAVSGAVCKARLLGINQASDGTILSNAESSDTTDSEGVAELELVRKDSVVKGSGIYKIWIEIGGRPTASIETAIPSQSTIYFEDLIK